jgi:hypothetical protein
VPVRHGVELAELPVPGDLDVVVVLDDHLLVIVECKSISDIDETHFALFLQRVHAFHPDITILLIDTPMQFSSGRIRAFNAALSRLGQPALIGNRGFYRGAKEIYVVNVEHSVATSLQDVLRYYQWHTQIH